MARVNPYTSLHVTLCVHVQGLFGGPMMAFCCCCAAHRLCVSGGPSQIDLITLAKIVFHAKASLPLELIKLLQKASIAADTPKIRLLC